MNWTKKIPGIVTWLACYLLLPWTVLFAIALWENPAQFGKLRWFWFWGGVVILAIGAIVGLAADLNARIVIFLRDPAGPSRRIEQPGLAATWIIGSICAAAVLFVAWLLTFLAPWLTDAMWPLVLKLFESLK